MLYTALGDSITFGYCSTDDEAKYVSRIRASLNRQAEANLFLHAKPGWTSTQLVKSLNNVPECIWAESKLITLLIGGNDVLKAFPWILNGKMHRVVRIAEKLQENLTKVIRTVRRPNNIIVLGTLYNPFPQSAIAEECTEILNEAIRMVAKTENVVLADLRKTFRCREETYIDGYRNGGLRDYRIIGNPIHPNDHGHKAIAHCFLRAYRRSLSTHRLNQQRSRAAKRASTRRGTLTSAIGYISQSST